MQCSIGTSRTGQEEKTRPSTAVDVALCMSHDEIALLETGRDGRRRGRRRRRRRREGKRRRGMNGLLSAQ